MPSASPMGVNGMSTASAIPARPSAVSCQHAWLCNTGVRLVRMRCTTSVCVTIDSTNQPAWNVAANSSHPCAPSVPHAPPATAGHTRKNSSANVTTSNTELTGPMRSMNERMDAVSQRLGARMRSASTLSHGMAVHVTSYIRFMSSSCTAVMSRNGRNTDATSTLKTLPKLELTVIFTYFTMFAYVRRPHSMPCSSTMRSFSSRMMSAASRATSTAESTDMPQSLARMAAASFTPSPM